MQISAHDIRMKEFRRALLRGYAEADVDDFLMALAVEVDRRDRRILLPGDANGRLGDHVAPREGEDDDVPPPDEAAGGDGRPAPSDLHRPAHARTDAMPRTVAGLDEQTARTVAADIIDQARSAAIEIRDRALAARDSIERDAEVAAKAVIDQAKANAERGLTKARERAQEMLAHAREQQQRAARADAEAQLRLAHVDAQLHARAEALAQEARRLDQLAGWLAEQDLAPDDAETGGHVPAHAAPDVVPLRRP